MRYMFLFFTAFLPFLPFYVVMELYIAFFRGYSCKKSSKKNLNVHDRKNRNLREETVWFLL